MTSIRGFADIGDPGAPIGSPEWCKYAHDGLRFKKRDTHSAVSSFKYMLLEFKNEQRWKQILDNNGNPFRSWQHYVEHEEPKGLGMPLASAKLVMEELDDSRLLGDVLTARANPVRPTAGAPPQVERDPNASKEALGIKAVTANPTSSLVSPRMPRRSSTATSAASSSRRVPPASRPGSSKCCRRSKRHAKPSASSPMANGASSCATRMQRERLRRERRKL